MNLCRDSFRACVLSTMISFIAIHSVDPVGEFASKLVGVRDISRIYGIVLSDWKENRVVEPGRVGWELR